MRPHLEAQLLDGQLHLFALVGSTLAQLRLQVLQM